MCRNYFDVLLSIVNDVRKIVFVGIPRRRKRLTELMIKTALNPDSKDIERWQNESRSWHLKFFRSPKAFLSDDNVTLSRLLLAANRLEVHVCVSTSIVLQAAENLCLCD